ncbi:hypothetical protein Tco_0496959 [Tanacetum coccineum]
MKHDERMRVDPRKRRENDRVGSREKWKEMMRYGRRERRSMDVRRWSDDERVRERKEKELGVERSEREVEGELRGWS